MAGPTDRGELSVAIGYNTTKDTVEIHFGTELSWLGFKPDMAKAFGETIIKAAEEAMKRRPN